jgi:hypothetical protein
LATAAATRDSPGASMSFVSPSEEVALTGAEES